MQEPHVTRTLLHAFLDPNKALPQQFGAVQGFAALGPNVVRLLVLPNLEPYLRLLEPEMQLEKQKNGMKRLEAWQVCGALMINSIKKAVNSTVCSWPMPVYPPTRDVWKSNRKVKTAISNKRKASMDNMMQQPPLKKLATDGPMGTWSANSVPADMPGASGVYAKNISGSGFPLMSRSFSNDNVLGMSRRRDVVASQGNRTSSVLDQAWKEDTEVGKFLPLLSDYFGESMFNYVPAPELAFFL